MILQLSFSGPEGVKIVGGGGDISFESLWLYHPHQVQDGGGFFGVVVNQERGRDILD